MHGDKSQRQRENALARFERGDVLTLVATDVAARGIDVPDVMRVINYDAPEDQATYVHRVGRTGRAGRTGTGISFVLADEVTEMRKIAKALGLEFGLARTEGGSVQPKPRREDAEPARESRQGDSRPSGSQRSARAGQKSGRGGSSGKPRRDGGKPRGSHSEKRQDERPQADGPRSKRRRRRRRKPTVTIEH